MNRRTKGILCIIASAFCFSLMNMFVRLAGDQGCIYICNCYNNPLFYWILSALRLDRISDRGLTVELFGGNYGV